MSHRNLLEWVTAARTKASPQLNWSGFYRQMAGGVTLGTGAAVLVAWVAPDSWPIAAAVPHPLVIVARHRAMDKSAVGGVGLTSPLSAADARSLRLIARRTWRFFETFVTAEDHMLPPDNFQEEPTPVVAHRTSPTNLGLYLLSVTAAHDFGWLGMTRDRGAAGGNPRNDE